MSCLAEHEYGGSARSTRLSWEETWLRVAATIGAARSRCDRRRVGAVIVDARNQVQGTGYNGPPAGYPVLDESRCGNWCPRAQSAPPGSAPDAALSYLRCPSVHAEVNALLQADRSRVVGGTLYVSSAVCQDCAKVVANSGVERVVMRVSPDDVHRQPDSVAGYLARCGLAITVVRAMSGEGDHVEAWYPGGNGPEPRAPAVTNDNNERNQERDRRS